MNFTFIKGDNEEFNGVKENQIRKEGSKRQGMRGGKGKRANMQVHDSS